MSSFTAPRKNVKLGTFRGSRAATAKKCTKKRDAVAKLLVRQSIVAFLPFSLPLLSMSSLLKSGRP